MGHDEAVSPFFQPWLNYSIGEVIAHSFFFGFACVYVYLYVCV